MDKEDSAVGFDRAPDRYMGKGRETIDRMRDVAYVLADNWPSQRAERDAIARALFSFACVTHAMKYEDRAGRKGDAAEDDAKARWYRQMAQHVAMGNVPDPRADRPGFVPYDRVSTSEKA